MADGDWEQMVISDERVAIFIDGSNFYHAVKDQRGSPRVDFEHLVAELLRGRELFRVFYYNASPNKGDVPDEQYKQQNNFFDSINHLPYFEVVLGYIDRGTQKGVDVHMTRDMIVHAFRDSYDTAIVVSGDSDFSVPIVTVKDLGKHVEHAFYPGWGRQLIQVADLFIDLTSFIQDPFEGGNEKEKEEEDG